MEKKQLAISVINAVSIVWVDLIRKFPQEKIEQLTEDDIKNATVDDVTIGLSAQSCFVKIKYQEELDEFLKMLCAMQSTNLSPYKELAVYAPSKDIYFSFRLLEEIKKTKAVAKLDDIKIDIDDLKQEAIKLNTKQLLTNDLQVVNIDENLSLIIGKAYRETWDILQGINNVYTTFRLFGSYEKKDKFSGFMCLFNPELNGLKQIFQAGIPPFVEDFKHIIVPKAEENNESN